MPSADKIDPMFTYRINNDIELRQLEESDAPELFALISRESSYLCQWLSSEYLYESLSEVRSFIFISSMRHLTNGAFDAGVWYQNHLAGVVELHTINHEKRRSDIGYWLGREFQGQGLMTMCVRAVVDYAFNAYKLKKLRIFCPINNIDSRAIPERLGFEVERIEPQHERINGRLVDDAVYVMFAHQWYKKRPNPHSLGSAE
jgi:ribosomal-protein-serine acetyltransferase